MYTSDTTILELRNIGALTDKGLDLSVLADGTRFGEDQKAITVGGVDRLAEDKLIQFRGWPSSGS